MPRSLPVARPLPGRPPSPFLVPAPTRGSAHARSRKSPMSQAKYSEHVLPAPPAMRRPASFGRRLRGPGTLARRAWRDAYVRRLVVWDAASALAAAGLARGLGFGPTHMWTTALPVAMT